MVTDQQRDDSKTQQVLRDMKRVYGLIEQNSTGLV
jgi:hypothetical protein